MEYLKVILPLGGVLIGALASYFLVKPKSKIIEEGAQREAESLRDNAGKESKRIIDDAKNYVKQLRDNVVLEETKMHERFEKLQEQAEARLSKREELLDQKTEKTEQRKEQYEASRLELEEKRDELQIRIGSQNKELEKISQFSKEEAKEELIKRIEVETEAQLADTMRKKIALVKETADEEASNILVQSIQRYASSVASETTVTIVKIESDSMKGKIIGREGRNINAFELLTGVDVIIDDTPGTITISSYDVFRRYVAKIALEELIKDGRIHPSKIEEMVKKSQDKADKLLLELGQKAVQDLGYTGLPEQILKLLGRLRFRTSYGQNVLTHSMEVAYLAQGIAEQVPGADPDVCLKAGLLHDIGKAVSHEVEGGHAIIGMEILEKFGIDQRIVVAMKSHHEDFPYESIEARILQAADAISASRPGARRETLDKYIKRLKEIESIAGSFSGVEKVFAIQAGREVRVFVNSAKVNDLESEKLSFEIARKLEKSCEYPGEVKVAVFRESKYEQIAK